jgi:hypothetical protein
MTKGDFFIHKNLLNPMSPVLIFIAGRTVSYHYGRSAPCAILPFYYAGNGRRYLKHFLFILCAARFCVFVIATKEAILAQATIRQTALLRTSQLFLA